MDYEDDYFYDRIGVSGSTETKLIQIELEFSSQLAPYIQTKPIHPTQSKPKFLENGNMIITVKVIPNYELERLLLSFGEGVRVLSPDHFRERIIKRLESNLAHYKGIINYKHSSGEYKQHKRK